MKQRVSGIIQLGAFVTILLGSIVLQRFFPLLDHVIGVTCFVLFVAAGVFLVFKAKGPSAPGPGILPQVGILPKRWQRWILGEDDRKDHE
jgi:hypothetical protein